MCGKQAARDRLDAATALCAAVDALPQAAVALPARAFAGELREAFPPIAARDPRMDALVRQLDTGRT